LQCINKQVFVRPDRVMQAMVACLEAQRRSVDKGMVPNGRAWEVIQLVPTRAGHDYLTCADRRDTSFWRTMVKIPNSCTFKSLSELSTRDEQCFIAEEAGRGLAQFGDFTADIDAGAFVSPLPGYRDTALYISQLDSVLAGHRSVEAANQLLPEDSTLRASTQRQFLVHLPQDEFQRRCEDAELVPYLHLLREHRGRSQVLLEALRSGQIRTVVIHGDTKLDNFLFSPDTRKLRCKRDPKM
jgi:hypothetical protein